MTRIKMCGLKKMADIFSNDPIFADEELADKYRKLSEMTE